MPDCDNCRETGVSKDVVSFCSECDLHFCVACDKLHGKFAPGHKTDFQEITDTAGGKVDGSTTYASCSEHSEESADYYCQWHESVICNTCKQSEHSQCTVLAISTAYEEIDISKEICNTFEQLIKLQETTDKLKREKQMALETYQTDIDERRYNIEGFRKRFNYLFDRYDAQLESQRALFVNDISFSMRSYARLSDQIREKTKSLEESLDIENGRLSFHQMINANHMYKKFKNKLTEVQNKRLSFDIFVKEEKDHKTLIDQLANLVNRVTESEEVVDSELDVGVDATTVNTQTKSFLDIKSCSVVTEADVRVLSDDKVPYIYGCCWMPDGQVILCDFDNSNIKILDKDFKIKFTAPCASAPFDVDCINETSAVVTLPSAKALQFISVKPGFKFQQKRDLNLNCKGACAHGKNIFVCIDESEPSKTGVKVLNLNGDDVSFISHLGSGDPRNLCVTTDGTKIYYTGGSDKSFFIKCVTKDGYGIFSVSSSDLKSPRGIVHDERNNIMICDFRKKCVQIINAEGKCGKILLTEKDIMYAPISISLNKTYDKLIIGSYKYILAEKPISKLTVYKLEYS